MNLIIIILILLPVALLITFFIGIVKKNKRLWLTSLIFLVLVVLAEVSWFTMSVQTGVTRVTSEEITTTTTRDL